MTTATASKNATGCPVHVEIACANRENSGIRRGESFFNRSSRLFFVFFILNGMDIRENIPDRQRAGVFPCSMWLALDRVNGFYVNFGSDCFAWPISAQG